MTVIWFQCKCFIRLAEAPYFKSVLGGLGVASFLGQVVKRCFGGRETKNILTSLHPKPSLCHFLFVFVFFLEENCFPLTKGMFVYLSVPPFVSPELFSLTLFTHTHTHSLSLSLSICLSSLFISFFLPYYLSFFLSSSFSAIFFIFLHCFFAFSFLKGTSSNDCISNVSFINPFFVLRFLS